MSWKLRELLVEAWRDLGIRQILAACLLGILLATVGILTAAQAQRAVAQTEARVAAGSFIWTAIAAPEQTLEGSVCESLVGQTGISAAGGVIAGEPPILRLVPETPPLPVQEITPGLIAVWEPGYVAQGAILGTDLESVGRVGVGSSVVAENGHTVEVWERTPPAAKSDSMRARLNLVTPPNRPVRECWIRTVAGAEAWGGEVLAAAFPDPSVKITPFVRAASGLETPAQQWRGFAGLRVWIIGGVLGGIVITFAHWTRRAHIAVYRAFGTGTGPLLALFGFQNFLLLVPTFCLSYLLSCFAGYVFSSSLGYDVARSIACTIGAATLITLVWGTIGSALIARGSIASALRDR
ncbi:Uncharacterised protein [Actinobaculum suis]|uniref:ABC transporter permease n=1 Tax=Actinobaculum suis TaxID=1657 RepID=A0A7Z8Y9D1_9ACTO|nr:hypothetical protein [Actinobaculum suis]VDG76421.1 Uncharacterised protein [Actinobaculum suis]